MVRSQLDVQGVDLAILRTCPEVLARRVSQVSVEVVNRRCPKLYAGAPACEEVASFFAQLGFGTQDSCETVFRQSRLSNSDVRCEGNMRFANGRAGLRPVDYKDRTVFSDGAAGRSVLFGG